VVAEEAATAALEHDAAWVEQTVAEAVTSRERLAAALRDAGLRVWPSAANFLLVAAPGDDAAAFAGALREAGIGVRPFPGLPQAGDCVRITVGPEPLMERLLQRVREVTGS
jgi:histidinol-phosphate/aromatic aminotransferase/cobyric acid decarboxylase-like protein